MGAEHSSDKRFKNHGYKVVSVQPNSPISKTDIEPYLDYICYEPDVDTSGGLDSILLNFEDKPIEVQVYNIVTRIKRDVTIVPSYRWGGDSLL